MGGRPSAPTPGAVARPSGGTTAGSARARRAARAAGPRGAIRRGAKKGIIRAGRVREESAETGELIKGAGGGMACGMGNALGEGLQPGAMKVVFEGVDRRPGHGTGFV